MEQSSEGNDRSPNVSMEKKPRKEDYIRDTCTGMVVCGSVTERKAIQEFTLRQIRTDIQQKILEQIEESMKLELEEKRIDQAMLETEAEIAKMKHKEFLAEKEIQRKRLEKETMDLDVQRMRLENERNMAARDTQSCVCVIL